MKCRNGIYGRGTLAFVPPASPEPAWTPPLMPRRLPCVTVAIRHGGESLSFQVRRGPHGLRVRGRDRTAAWCGKVVAVALEGLLP